jgi:hypothetical protein
MVSNIEDVHPDFAPALHVQLNHWQQQQQQWQQEHQQQQLNQDQQHQ